MYSEPMKSADIGGILMYVYSANVSNVCVRDPRFSPSLDGDYNTQSVDTSYVHIDPSDLTVMSLLMSAYTSYPIILPSCRTRRPKRGRDRSRALHGTSGESGV